MTDHLVLRHLELGDGPAFAIWGLDRRFCEYARGADDTFLGAPTFYRRFAACSRGND